MFKFWPEMKWQVMEVVGTTPTDEYWKFTLSVNTGQWVSRFHAFVSFRLSPQEPL